MNIEKQIKDLAARYADCGIDGAVIREMMGKHKQFHDIRNSKKFLSHGVRKGMGPFGFAPRKKKTAPDAANIKSGKAELVNTPASASILPDGQEDCKR